MAPEIVDSPNARINKKCDMCSYAMVLYELVTLKVPFHDAPTDQKAMMNAALEKRPVLPESDAECPPFLRCLITTVNSPNTDALVQGLLSVIQGISFIEELLLYPHLTLNMRNTGANNISSLQI